MTADGSEIVQQHTNWRGPRRLNAIYTNKADWDAAVDTPAVGSRLARRNIPQTGVIHLRTGDSTVERTFKEPVGTLVRRQTKKGTWETDKTATTQRERLVPLINHVAASGPVPRSPTNPLRRATTRSGSCGHH